MNDERVVASADTTEELAPHLRPGVRDVPLLMRLSELTLLPPLVVPERHVLRLAEPSDHSGLAEFMRLVFGPKWDIDHLERELGVGNGVRSIYLVTRDDQIVATASARFWSDAYPGSGYVHYVGVHPDHRGRGLGEVVTIAVVEFFKTAGCRDVVLETGDLLFPALRTYLRIGFVPEYRREIDRARWADVMRMLFKKTGGAEGSPRGVLRVGRQ